jgi:hypothetical protein
MLNSAALAKLLCRMPWTKKEGEMLGTVLLNVRRRQARFWLRTTLVCFMSAQSDSAGSVPQSDQWLATIVRAEQRLPYRLKIHPGHIAL